MVEQEPTPTEQPEEGGRAAPTAVDSVSVEAVAPVVKAATGDSERVVLVWGGISNFTQKLLFGCAGSRTTWAGHGWVGEAAGQCSHQLRYGSSYRTNPH